MTDNLHSAACVDLQRIQFSECGFGVCGFRLTTDFQNKFTHLSVSHMLRGNLAIFQCISSNRIRFSQPVHVQLYSAVSMSSQF